MVPLQLLLKRRGILRYTMKRERARLLRCCCCGNSSYTGNFTLRRGNKCAPLTHASAIPARLFRLSLSPCFVPLCLPPLSLSVSLSKSSATAYGGVARVSENEKEEEEKRKKERKKGERYTPCNLPPYCSAFKDLY